MRDLFKEVNKKYALSTIRATFETYRYWLRQGYSDKHSMDNGIKYGVAQIQSIVTPDSIRDSLHDFEMISTASQRLADVLQVRLQAADAEKKIVESPL